MWFVKLVSKKCPQNYKKLKKTIINKISNVRNKMFIKENSIVKTNFELKFSQFFLVY